MHRICNAGFLRVEPLCQPCGAGTYSTTAGATVCQACTNAQAIANTYYLTRTTTIGSANDCPWCVFAVRIMLELSLTFW